MERINLEDISHQSSFTSGTILWSPKMNISAYALRVKETGKSCKFQLFPNCQEECKIERISSVTQSLVCFFLERFILIISLGLSIVFFHQYPKLRRLLFYKMVDPFDSTGVIVYGCDGDMTFITYLDIENEEEKIKVFEYRFQRFQLLKSRKFVPYFENAFAMKCSELINFPDQVEVTAKRIKQSNQKNGINKTDIPDKGLIYQCLKELMSPYYFFQACSYLLWFYEEYLIYCYVIVTCTILGYLVKMYTERVTFLKLKKFSFKRRNVTVVRKGIRKIINNDQIIFGEVVLLNKGEESSCDLLIVSGSAIVNESLISGDCMPIIKDAIIKSDDQFVENKINIIYSGSIILSCTNLKCIAFKIGFETSKGTSIRSIMFPKKTNQISFGKDQLYFIMIMAVAALISLFASLSTFIHKIENQLIETKELVIRILDLTVISIPPVLPLCLSFGLIISLIRLRNKSIFCINSKKIKTCGILKILCFDKTGTLTENDLEYKMISIFNFNKNQKFVNFILQEEITNENKEQFIGFGACHHLRLFNGNVIGDPLDIEMLKKSQWEISKKNEYDLQREGRGVLQEIVNKKDSKHIIEILKIFPFENKYVRMSTIVRYKGYVYLLTKGNPEMMKNIFSKESLPEEEEGSESYNGKLFRYTQSGLRVIAFGAKNISPYDIGKPRKKLENNLKFCGFLVFENKLKKGVTENLRKLKQSNISIIMVTGDNPFTSIKIARHCNILSNLEMNPVLDYENNQIVVIQGDNINHVDTISEAMLNVNKEAEVIATGNFFKSFFESIDQSNDHKEARQLLFKTKVFSRMSADQKSKLVGILQQCSSELNYTFVGVCGDGANDCLALKNADMGLALGNTEASLASGFISKVQNIDTIEFLIREGRGCLTSYFQSFKFMGIYSMIQNSTAGIIYFKGVVPGEFQYLYWDLFVVLPLSFLMALTQSSDKLHQDMPPHRLFSPSNFISILGQGLLQFIFLSLTLVLTQLQSWYINPINYMKEGGFEPSDVATYSFDNTVLFWVSNFQYVCCLLSFTAISKHNKGFYTNFFLSFYIICILGFNSYLMFTKNDDIIDFFEINPDLLSLSDGSVISSMPFYWRFIVLIIILVNLFCTLLFELVIVNLIVNKLEKAFPSLKYQGIKQRKIETQETIKTEQL